MAKVNEIGQLKQFECTYAGCQKRFDTIKEMKRHKVNESEHNFCKKCDVDCDDWEALTQHKVDAMIPWLEGSMRHHKEESPNHIVASGVVWTSKASVDAKYTSHRSVRSDTEIAATY